MLHKLINGDILIELDQSITHFDQDEMYRSIIQNADHGMIYYHGKIIHSSEGKHQLGVRSHELSSITNKYPTIGFLVVLRHKDEKIREQLSHVAKVWDPSLTRDAINHRFSILQAGQAGPALLPTPFTNLLRKKDHFKLSQRYECYRAFRAYLRNHTSYHEKLTNIDLQATPISKHKGVSCSNFLFYSLKTSLIKKYYDQCQLEEIVGHVKEIELVKEKYELKHLEDFDRLLEKLESQSELTKEDKVTVQTLQIFKNFDAILKEKLLAGKAPKTVFAEIATRVKGKTISFFADHALHQNSNFDLIGFVCDASNNCAADFKIVDINTMRALIAANNNDLPKTRIYQTANTSASSTTMRK